LSKKPAFVAAIAFGTLAAMFAVPRSGHAQDTGIAVERFAPAAGPSAFGQIESAAVPVPAQLWLTGGLLTIGRPLVLRSAVTGEEIAVPVRNRVTLDLGAELGLWRQRLSIGVGIPLAVWQAGDRLQKTGGADGDAVGAGEPLQLIALGDIRVRAKMRLTSLEAPIGVAALFEVTAPGGGQHDFVATSSVTVAPRLITSFRFRWLVGAANLAVRFMPERTLYQTQRHHAFEWGAALGAILPVRRIGLGLYTEASGQLNLTGPAFEHGAEIRGALRIGWFQGTVDFGGGAGFGPFTPGWRGFVILRTWFGESGIVGCPVRPITF
jgi:hypothetical protein